jgi:hypothetical protein
VLSDRAPLYWLSKIARSWAPSADQTVTSLRRLRARVDVPSFEVNFYWPPTRISSKLIAAALFSSVVRHVDSCAYGDVEDCRSASASFSIASAPLNWRL